MPNYPLERVLVGHPKEEDNKSKEIHKCLNLATKEPHKWEVEPFEHDLGPPTKPYIEEFINLELKTLSTHLRYTVLVAIETLPIIVSTELSKIHVDTILRIVMYK